MGGVSFYKTGQDGFLAREKGGVDAERIKNDPNFARTRENGAEFGRAGSAAKLLRTAFRSLILSTKDSRMSSRLTKEMVKVVQADTTNARGDRNVIDGEAELLLGFEFNDNARLGSTFFGQYEPTIDRVSGSCEVTIANFLPDQMIAGPSGTTHFRLIMGMALIDFEAGTFMSNLSHSGELVLDNGQTGPVILSNVLSAGMQGPVFVVFGIEFFQHVNNQFYPLKNGSYNALSLVAVDGGV